MRVRVRDIPSEGRLVEEALGVAWGDAALGSAVRTQPPGIGVVVQVDRVGEKVLLRGECTARVLAECDRCLEEVTLDLGSTFTHVLEPRPKDWEEEVELTEDDLDMSYLDGPEVEIDDIVREHLLLAVPMRMLCTKDCKGLCPQCGVNLNRTQCDCGPAPIDPRWQGLLKFRKES